MEIVAVLCFSVSEESLHSLDGVIGVEDRSALDNEEERPEELDSAMLACVVLSGDWCPDFSRPVQGPDPNRQAPASFREFRHYYSGIMLNAFASLLCSK